MNSKIDKVISDIRNGIPVIVVDDYDRENEGDIVISAEKATNANINFCMRHARGLMCIPCSGEVLDRLKIPMMVEKSTDKNNTPFTVSVDAANNTTTGMSVNDRLKTIEIFVNETSIPDDLNRPGHLFPLRARDGLLHERRGHTEASIALMKLSKLKPVSIIVEIINDDGTMARGDDIGEFAKNYNLNVISVEEIYEDFCKESIQ